LLVFFGRQRRSLSLQRRRRLLQPPTEATGSEKSLGRSKCRRSAFGRRLLPPPRHFARFFCCFIRCAGRVGAGRSALTVISAGIRGLVVGLSERIFSSRFSDRLNAAISHVPSAVGHVAAAATALRPPLAACAGPAETSAYESSRRLLDARIPGARLHS